MSFRRRSREIALQILFQREFTPQKSTPAPVSEALDHYGENFELHKDVREFAELIVNGVLDNQSVIDEKIQNYSQNWKLNRMALVDKNILRIATYELLFNREKIPPQVAIDEAIEVGKRYGSQDSSNFINGVLDNILKSRDL